MDVLDKELDKQIEKLSEEKANAEAVLADVTARLSRVENAKAALSGTLTTRRSGTRHLSRAASENQVLAQKKRRLKDDIKVARGDAKADLQKRLAEIDAQMDRNRAIIVEEKAQRRRAKA
jgi:hypothetical protein